MTWNYRWVTDPQTNEVVLAPLCNNTDQCFRPALAKMLSDKSIYDEYCGDCTPQCTTTDFIVQTSSQQAPPDWRKDDIKRFVENSTIPLPKNWSTSWSEIIDDNFLSISVVQESSIVETNTQTASLQTVDLLSNIGGQTGLWIGISFLSIMEIVETVYLLIEHEFRRFRQRSAKN